jgi:hypothetical protein
MTAMPRRQGQHNKFCFIFYVPKQLCVTCIFEKKWGAWGVSGLNFGCFLNIQNHLLTLHLLSMTKYLKKFSDSKSITRGTLRKKTSLSAPIRVHFPLRQVLLLWPERGQSIEILNLEQVCWQRSSSSFMDHWKSHVAAGPSVRLGL